MNQVDITHFYKKKLIIFSQLIVLLFLNSSCYNVLTHVLTGQVNAEYPEKFAPLFPEQTPEQKFHPSKS